MQDDTFAQLVLQANAGDSASYGTLYEHFFTPVYRYVYARTLDRGIATDIAQDTFLKVYQQLGTHKLIHGTLYTYFITIARNTLYDWYRKKRPEFFSEEDEGSIVDRGPTPVEEAIAQDDKMFLEQLLAKLSRTVPRNTGPSIIRRTVIRSYCNTYRYCTSNCPEAV